MRRDSRFATALIAVFLLLSFSSSTAQVDREAWHEDVEKVEQVWKHGMSGEAYMNAMRTTEMLDVVQKNSLRIEGTGWHSIGPAGGVQPFGYSGRIAGIQIHNAGGTNYVYVGGSSGGLWRTPVSSGFHVWESLGDALPNPSVRAFAIHPSNPNEIIVGTGDEARYRGAGMFRTTDGGASWTQIPLAGSPSSFFRIQFVPGNPNSLLAASNVALFRSTDGGNTWSVVVAGYATDLAIDPVNPDNQYAVVSNFSAAGVYKSTDRGASWTRKALPVTRFGRASLALCRNLPLTLVCMAESSMTLQAVLKSTDGGETWSAITSNLRSLFGFASNQILHAQAIAIRPSDPNDIIVGGVKLARSTNGGASWSLMDDNVFLHNDIAQLHFNNLTGDDVLWIGTDGGLARYPFGGSGENWNGTGLNGLRCSQIDYMDAQRTFIAIGLQDNGVLRSTTSGALWETKVVGDGFDCEITDDLGFEYWHADGIYDSSPLIRVSRQRLTGNPEWTNNTQDQAVLFFDRYNSKMYSIAGNTLTSTTTSGTPSWNTEATLPALRPMRIFGSELGDQTLYIANAAGPTLTICRRNGTSWDTTKSNFVLGTNVSTVYPSRETVGEAWAGMYFDAGTGPTIYHTTNYGQTWLDISGNLFMLLNEVRAIVTKPFNPTEIYIGTNIGVFRTTDGGTTWTPFQEGLPAVVVTDLRYIVDPNHSGADRLLAATYGRGMYEHVITTRPTVYVDQSATGFEDGTFEHPYRTFSAGMNNVNGGTLGLRGNQVFNGVTLLNQSVTLVSFGGAVILRP